MGGGKFPDAKLDGSNSPPSELRPSLSLATILPQSLSTQPLSPPPSPPSPQREEKHADDADRDDDDAAAVPFRYPATVVVTVPATTDGHHDTDQYSIACAQMLAAEIVARSRLRCNAPVDLVSLEHLLFRRLVGAGDGELSAELEGTRVDEHRGRTTYPLVGVSLDTLRWRLCRDVVPHEIARGEWQRRVDQVLLELSQVSSDTRRLAEFAWWCAFGIFALALAVVALTTYCAGTAAADIPLYAGMESHWHDWFGVGGPIDVYYQQSMDAASPRASDMVETESRGPSGKTIVLILALVFGMSRFVFDVALVAVVWTAALYGLRLAPCVAFYAVAWCTVCRWLGEWHSESSTVPDHPTQTRPQISAVLARHVARLPSAPAYWVAHVDSVVGRRDTGYGDVIVVREGVVLETLRQSYADPSHPRYSGDSGVLYVRLVAPGVANDDVVDSGGDDDEKVESEANDDANGECDPRLDDADSSSDTLEIPYADEADGFCDHAVELLRKRLRLRAASASAA